MSKITAALLAATLAGPAAAQSPDSSKALTVEKLAEGIYLFRAPSSLDLWTATNSVVIIGDRDVVVFDSFTRAVTARMAIAEIRKLTDKPVSTVINSHWHQDHWSGNGEFLKAFPGIQIISTTGARDYMRRMPGAFYARGLARSVRSARAALDSAVRTGKLADGTPLTAEARRAREQDIEETSAFDAEVRALTRVFPDVTFNDSLVLYRGRREIRLFSGTGDATASTIMFLPKEKILVMGDALVAREDGSGSPPWTTNSYAITPWLETLRRVDALDASIIVPGQGKAFHDEQYLETTIDVFAAVIEQVHKGLEQGLVEFNAVLATVDVDAIGRRYRPDGSLPSGFRAWVAVLARKVYQEALDGVAP